MGLLSYSELVALDTFEKRFEYVQLHGRIGQETFGYDRYLNQQFYSSSVWRSFRDQMAIRDRGCDLGVDGRELNEQFQLHHLNPLVPSDILNENPALLDPENVIIVSPNTHKAIHYGNKDLLVLDPIIRYQGDTCLWRKHDTHDEHTAIG